MPGRADVDDARIGTRAEKGEPVGHDVHKRTDTRCCGGYRCPMLTTVAIVLLVLWLLGMVTSTAMGGLIHILLVVAIVMLLIRVIQGRRLI